MDFRLRSCRDGWVSAEANELRVPDHDQGDKIAVATPASAGAADLADRGRIARRGKRSGAFIDPLPGSERALDVDFGTFRHVLFGDADEALIEDHDPVPLGSLAALARLPVAPVIAGGDRQTRDLLAIIGRADLRIPAEIADQDRSIEISPFSCRLLEAAALETDPAKRVQEFTAFQRQVIQDLPDITVSAVYYATIADQTVIDHTLTADGVCGNLADVYIDASTQSSDCSE